ncbi:hypothetical protein [Chryseobacterium echinoideorum]|uniref:hypothetical protein n=1 Tax=Chryseobacterium echinoideorum TaxID=1549648 RepID=UPI001186371B|nr:hypothetical protein [Chryseobacterium echinoideorum]
MKNIQIIGLVLVIVGSFLPLVHIPVIGSWNYWQVDHYLAITCWVLSLLALFGIINNNQKFVRIIAVLLIALFVFTIFATKYQAFSYFSFLPFKSWTETLAATVKLKWGWIVEFAGAFTLFFASRKLKY